MLKDEFEEWASDVIKAVKDSKRESPREMHDLVKGVECHDGEAARLLQKHIDTTIELAEYLERKKNNTLVGAN